MTKPTQALKAALNKFNRDGLSQLLFDNKSEVACSQRLCEAINESQKEDKEYLARVEYTNKGAAQKFHGN